MKTRLLLFVAVAVCILSTFAFFYRRQPQPVGVLTRQLRLAIVRDANDAWSLGCHAREVYPTDPNVLSLAAEAAAQVGEESEMIGIVTSNLNRLLSADTPPGSRTIKTLIDAGYHQAAQELLDYRLLVVPNDTFALRTRSDLSLRHGHHYSATLDLRRLLADGAISLDDLVFLSSRREFLEDRDGLLKAASLNPGFAQVTVGLGSLAAFQGDLPKAQTLLEATIRDETAPAEAWATLGLVYYRQGLIADKLQIWRMKVRALEHNHPDIHFVKGWMASQESAYQDAVLNLCRAMQQSPLHRGACQLLSTLLTQHSSEAEIADFFSQRSGSIHNLEQLAHGVLFGDRNSESMEKIARLCQQLGETDLTFAWRKAAALHQVALPGRGRINSGDEKRGILDSRSIADQLNRLLSRGIADQFKIANRSDTTAHPESADVSESRSDLKFVNVASMVGINQNYFGGFDNPEAGLWIYQQFGGGVAVIDFDNDDIPDFCLTQAGSLPATTVLPHSHQDLLYRNRGDRFDQVNRVAFDGERGFGQGIAVGDADRDGFPDLYIANIGPNRLLMNNGDGTFRSVDLTTNDESGPGWTASCLLADLDSDGFDDLYNVQYLHGADPFEKVCQSGRERLFRGCMPSLFDPAHDEFYQSLRDGTFDDQSQRSGLPELRGRGLGIVAADLDGVPGLEVFVSNDMSPNHYLKIQQNDSGIRFENDANLRGLAGNGEGQVEACMGVGAADISGDGKMDLFVTNFFNETNTYYESQAEGFFRDQGQIAQLTTMSLKKLGFGVQPLDADLDGDWDLLVANGHVDDFRHLDVPWKMTGDLMENTGRANFRHCRSGCLGEYGQREVLGRAVARVDWNRDGLPDAIITHLDGPPALLENRTSTTGHSLSLHLTGTESNRPAIGTVITVRLAGQDLVLQSIAGDGYFCSNDRVLQIGTGQTAVIPEIEIRWPSGTIKTFTNVPTDCRIRAVEGKDSIYRLNP